MKLSKVEELKLISRCVLVDDRRAFAQLVEAYQPRLRAFLLNLTCGDDYLTDDIAQETFIKAYYNIRSFKGLSQFSTWLYRIACNQYYSEMRRCREAELTGEANADVLVQNTEQTVAAKHDVQVALRELNDLDRTIVTLYYINDLPAKEVARILNINVNSVKSRIVRARKKLHDVLA